MMKYWSLIFMVIVLSGVSGQTVDSLAIRQVDSLIQVSRTLTTQKEFVKALEVNASAEQIAFTKLGRESLSYSNVSFNRGRINEFKSDYKEAEKGYLESKNIIEKLLGKEHLDYAWSLNNIAAMYNDMGNNDKAEPLYLEALAIRGKALGKEHLDYAISLSNLGTMYVDMGIYEKAEQYFLEAKAIREKVLGKEHPDYAKSLNKLATFYGRTGKYEQAEPLFIEATAIVEKSLGKEHPDYASSLGNLAILYKIMGNYGKAELLYLETKDIWEKLIGKEHPDYAKSLGNLAILYKLMGNYEKAELLYLEAIVIWEKVFGKEHPDYASNLSNLALLYSVMGRYEKAEQLFLETKSITEKAFGKEHPQYAHILNSLGNMFMKIDKFENAEPLFNEALATQEKIFGKEHPEYAHTLHNLAILNKTRGNYKKAEQLYIESKAIYVTTLGKEHPSYSQCLKNMALFYENQNNYRDSELLLDEYFMLTKTSLIRSTTFLSEQELAKFEGTYQTMGDQLSSFLFARQSKFGQQSILPELIFDHSLFQKGFLLSAATRLHFPETTSPETAEINLRLIGFRRRLAAEYSKPIAKRKGITELEGNANLAEKELARSVDGYADAIRQVKWQDVKAVLQQSEAAIEFIHFKVNFPFSTDSTMYAAILVLPGAEQPKFIPLFEERVLGHLVQSNTERKADYVNELYSLSDRGLVKLGSERQSLYDLVWRPLDSDLAGIKTIYFSPSGLLHRINMDAIPLSEAETIADKYQLIALNSTRQIVIPTPLDNTNNDAVLFGGIQFEHDSTNLNNEPLLASRSRGDLSFTSVDSTLRGGSWNYLAGTEREVKAIEKIMQISGINTKLRKGYEATEESFKNIGANNAPSPRILHIATHGYFFPDPKSNTAGTGLGGEQETVFKISDHPMLRSGLILAGGNAAWQGNQTLEGREDGILTAYEISQMNLSNTELVVLSACETGLGEIQGNEGVYGLQRAFKIAGAKYLIMSLWQVPDKQTSLLMTTFYKKWLELKMSIPEAFHSAQKELRDIGLDPYQWAGFVLVE